jgi:threonylcarbamoyladenosine tRNA methylthiotransferase MtaB
MPESFKIITLGCKVNQYESAYLKEELAEAGLLKTPDGEKADLIVINTCVVTRSAASQSRQEIRKAVRENPGSLVIATGCYAQGFPEELSKIKGLDLIWGNTEKKGLADHILNKSQLRNSHVHVSSFDERVPFEFLPLRHFTDRTRAFLKIQDGCRSFCSYCIVPFTRGPLRSLPPVDVLKMVETLAEEGHKEIVLTGIHLGKYGADLTGSIDLKVLLRSIVGENFPLRLRLSSLEPNEIDDELVELVAAEKWICKHFHIPLQSGDDKILQKMNRTYSSGDFARLIESIRRTIPRAGIGVDIMSGFPGEDSSAHKKSCALIGKLPVTYLHVFPFSPREGTAAAGFQGRVEPETIRIRTQELRKIGIEKKEDFYRQCIGRTFQVLAEGRHLKMRGFAKGMTDNYIPVVFPSEKDLSNQFVEILLENLEGGSVTGSRTMDAGRKG